MSDAKHTPGPWTARFDEAITIRDAADNQLAICTHIRTKQGGRRDTSEVEATARLIAAAPELLDALEYMLEEMIETGASQENNDTVAFALEVIAKATGSAA